LGHDPDPAGQIVAADVDRLDTKLFEGDADEERLLPLPGLFGVAAQEGVGPEKGVAAVEVEGGNPCFGGEFSNFSGSSGQTPETAGLSAAGFDFA
jgi:hypothetical protein